MDYLPLSTETNPPDPRDYFLCYVHRWGFNEMSNEILPPNPFSLVNPWDEVEVGVGVLV